MTTRPIDRMLAAIRRDEGEELLLVTGQPIRVRTGEAVRVILAQDMRSDQIVSLLRDIVPTSATQGLFSDGEMSFPYDAPSGPFLVHARRQGAHIDALLKPRSGGAAQTSAELTPRGTAIGVVQLQQRLVAAPRPEPPPPSATREGSGKIGVLKNQIDPVLVSLVTSGGSDLHLTAGIAPRMRVDRELVPLPGFPEPLPGDAIRSWLLEVAPEAARARFERTNDADYAYEIPSVGRFRVNVFRDRRGASGVLRVIPSRVPTADELGLPQAVRDLCALPRGLILVTGPANSGRTTTLATLVDVVNETRAEHVITIEDPVEFVHESKRALVNQRELHAHTDSWTTALQAAMREDPDVIVVSNLRDPETLTLALEIAETGHLVIGALRLPTAGAALERILDVVPLERQQQTRVMLAESLRGVVAQTLCRRAAGGRVAAFEVLLGLPPVANVIREGKLFQIPALLQQGRTVGMQSLNDALVRLVEEGVVTAEEAYHRAVDKVGVKPALERVLHRAS